ncbi:MAG: hypothetical protein PHN88_04595 [Ignavibacteria bacterium]|nr:hypothetical protein [Ignavibacteria bacterium]
MTRLVNEILTDNLKDESTPAPENFEKIAEGVVHLNFVNQSKAV